MMKKKLTATAAALAFPAMVIMPSAQAAPLDGLNIFGTHVTKQAAEQPGTGGTTDGTTTGGDTTTGGNTVGTTGDTTGNTGGGAAEQPGTGGNTGGATDGTTTGGDTTTGGNTGGTTGDTTGNTGGGAAEQPGTGGNTGGATDGTTTGGDTTTGGNTGVNGNETPGTGEITTTPAAPEAPTTQTSPEQPSSALEAPTQEHQAQPSYAPETVAPQASASAGGVTTHTDAGVHSEAPAAKTLPVTGGSANQAAMAALAAGLTAMAASGVVFVNRKRLQN